ncbi:retrovirus-related pol polyprotein from transposon TNT 1-94 [Tanacetum coccineum]
MPKSSLQLIDEVVDKGVPEKEPAHDDEEANLQRALELSLKEQGEQTQGPARPVVIREPDSGRIQPLPEVQGKGKEKRRTPMPTEPSEHADSPSLDAELALTDSETESEEEVPMIKAGDQDEGQAGPNPDEEFTTITYLNVQENLKLLTEDQEEEPGKTNAEAEVQSMVLVPIHQDTSSVPPMTTLVIDLTKSQSDSPLSTSTATTSTITTTTTLQPPPLQSTTDPILVRRIGELEQHIVSKVVDEIVTDAVDWAMQAPLRARFRYLPTIDMKEILQQRMFKDNTYKTHEVHNDLYAALQKYENLHELIEECHKMLTDQVDWTNPKGAQVRVDVNRPLALGGPPGHVTIQMQFFFYEVAKAFYLDVIHLQF